MKLDLLTQQWQLIVRTPQVRDQVGRGATQVQQHIGVLYGRLVKRGHGQGYQHQDPEAVRA
ncbi:MAG TPA: hypothetical protein VK822_04100 [Acetobacteraceae bacterium]|nr:hypothetical protein [Acetobacteraceae bacterium]